MDEYLATTGLQEYWDLDKKLLLLGPWCVSSERNKKLLERKKDYILIPSPWKPTVKIKEAADYCWGIYERLLTQLADNLNAIHSVSYPPRYWTILLGPWLIHFIEIFYDRFMRIEKAKEMFPDFTTRIILFADDDLAEFDTHDFVLRVEDDDYYNFQLFSFLLHKLCLHNINIVEPSVRFSSTATKINHSDNVNGSLYKKIIYKMLNCCSRNSIILCDMCHLKFIDMFSLQWKTKFKEFSFLDFQLLFGHVKEEKSVYSCEVRKKIALGIDASCEFESLLNEVIPKAIPRCYIEYFDSFRKQITAAKGIDSVKIVGSAIGWYFNEEFKFLAAEATVKGARMADFQHGGGYGLSLAIPTETLSLEKDMFYTWGWRKEGCNNTKPLPSPHLSKIKNKFKLQFDNALLVGIDMSRYHYRFHTIIFPEDMSKFFDDKKIFFRNLKDEIKEKLLYRPYDAKLRWEEDLVRQECPKARFILNGKLVDWFRKVRLVIIDHPHTSFLEALTINVPSVFYWDHEVYLMREEAEGYFDMLRKAGIVYKDPLSAAIKVNEIIDNPMDWWGSSKVQDAVCRFCKRYAYTKRDWLKMWIDEFERIESQVG